jgi:hypothetical protein
MKCVARNARKKQFIENLGGVNSAKQVKQAPAVIQNGFDEVINSFRNTSRDFNIGSGIKLSNDL